MSLRGTPRSDHARVADAIHLLADAWREPPDLGALAARSGLSPHHFQRTFRRLVGVSPKRFGQALAADHAERLLEAGQGLLPTAHASGRTSAGRLHDLTVSVRAMTPGELRRGGEGLSIRCGVHPTPLGEVAIALTERGICELAFVDGQDPVAALRLRWPRSSVRVDPAAGAGLAAQLFDASAAEGPLSLHVAGTNFQLRVWHALLAIPPGRVTTYGALARTLGAPSSARAIGGAVGANPVALLIPCHRVLRMCGELGGYRWGLSRKRALLALEHARDVGPSR